MQKKGMRKKKVSKRLFKASRRRCGRSSLPLWKKNSPGRETRVSAPVSGTLYRLGCAEEWKIDTERRGEVGLM